MEYKSEYWAGLDLGQSQDFSALIAPRVTRPVPPESGPRVVHDPAMGTTSTFVERAPKSLVEEWEEWDRCDKLPRYAVVGIRRWDTGVLYTTVVDDVVDIFSRPPLRGGTLVVDKTGVGAAVVNMFEKARDRGVECTTCQGHGTVPFKGDRVTCLKCNGSGKVKLHASIRPVTITAGSGASVDGAGWRVSKKELVSVMQVLLQSNRLALPASKPETKLLTKELEMFRVKVTTAANETFEAWRERDHDDLVLALAIAVWAAERGSQQVWVR